MMELIQGTIIAAKTVDRIVNKPKYVQREQARKERRSRMTYEERRKEDFGKYVSRMM